MKHEGLDWGAYQRAKIRKELIEEEKKKKKKGTTEARRRSCSESDCEEDEEPQQQKDTTEKKIEDDDLHYLEQFRDFYEEMLELQAEEDNNTDDAEIAEAEGDNRERGAAAE